MLLLALAACGSDESIPGNAVAEVNGSPVTKSDFDKWMAIYAKSSAQQTGGDGTVPDSPEFTRCVASKLRSAPKPAAGQPKPTKVQFEQTCKQEYEALKSQVLELLINGNWLEGEAKDLGVKVTDAEVQKNFQQQKKQAFPKDADYQKYLKQSGFTEADLLYRIRLEVISNKIRDKATKGKDKVTPQQIQAFYAKNKAQFAQPESRDVNVVLTKTKAEAEKAKQAIEDGQSFSSVAKKYSVDKSTKANGGKLQNVVRGQSEKAFDDAVFAARKGQLEGPVKTQFGYYVFEVTGITPEKQQSLTEATPTIRQQVTSQNQQKALDAFVKDYRDKWKARTSCRKGFVTQDCKNAPKQKGTTTTPPGGVPQTQQQAPQGGGTATTP